MKPPRDGRQMVREAFQIAKDHGMFVVEKTLTGIDSIKTIWIVYRKTDHARPIRLGKRSTAAGIRSFVDRCAGLQ